MARLRSALLGALLIGLTAIALGHFSAPPSTTTWPTVEFADFMSPAAGTLIVDARAPYLYETGHVPTAVSLPISDFDKVFPAVKAMLDGKSLIIYCSGHSCPDSKKLAMRLAQKGYKTISIYPGGWEEWEATGMPKEGVSP